MTTADVYGALWRHKIFILVLTACFAAGAYVVTKRKQPVYEASSLVRIQQSIESPREAFGALETGGRLAQTYAKIVTTRTIARKIYIDLDGAVPLGEIVGHVTGAQIDDLELLAIQADSASPRRAELIANAAPRALRAFIQETGTLRDQVTTVQNATAPGSAASPNVRMTVILAVLIGLIFNGALALVRELLSDRFGGPDELERITHRRVLVTMPTVSFKSAAPFDRDRPAERGEPVSTRGRDR
jgi:capsular polysaccharide biosynthesis protein